MLPDLTRRTWMFGVPAAIAATASRASAAPRRPVESAFRFGLNTYTIHGQKLSLVEEIDLVAEAGYDGIEPWVMEIDEYVKAGGSLPDLAKRIRDKGLVVYDVIGFPEWAVDDDARRKKGFEEARRGMELAHAIGGQRIAAPPLGTTDKVTDPRRVAERYRELLKLGEEFGVVPQIEIWGHSQTLGRLGDAALVAIEADHPSACILADVYHLYKGGSSLEGLKLLSSSALQVFHMNDYPASPPRSEIKDEHRIYPGDGIAPLREILCTLHAQAFCGFLSLELFNRDYWKRDARDVARTGLEKMRGVAQAALAG